MNDLKQHKSITSDDIKFLKSINLIRVIKGLLQQGIFKLDNSEDAKLLTDLYHLCGIAGFEDPEYLKTHDGLICRMKEHEKIYPNISKYLLLPCEHWLDNKNIDVNNKTIFTFYNLIYRILEKAKYIYGKDKSVKTI